MSLGVIESILSYFVVKIGVIGVYKCVLTSLIVGIWVTRVKCGIMRVFGVKNKAIL